MNTTRNRPRLTGLSFLLAAAVWAFPLTGSAQTPKMLEEARKEMVRKDIVGAGIKNERVIESMLQTPRHEFVPLGDRRRAYFDMALPIGENQTISSPFIVALMTETLDPQPEDRVLEIGTGSGYQAAVLSPLVKEVYTIEIVPELGRRAERTLQQLGYKNVFVKVGDGYLGWPEHRPFDKIIVTCSPEKVPQPLVDQLAEGGRIVIPVGERYQQTLYLFKKEEGELKSEAICPVLFVPMTGNAEQQRQVQPDPTSPEVINGDFEQPAEKEGEVPGWYYQSQVRLEEADDAPRGERFVTMENETPELGARLLQGLGLDGRRVRKIELSAWVKTENAQPLREKRMYPLIMISFYDENRRSLGQAWLGPFTGTSRWHEVSKTIVVPPLTREAIIRIGLFGGTGSISFDDIRIKAAQ